MSKERQETGGGKPPLSSYAKKEQRWARERAIVAAAEPEPASFAPDRRTDTGPRHVIGKVVKVEGQYAFLQFEGVFEDVYLSRSTWEAFGRQPYIGYIIDCEIEKRTIRSGWGVPRIFSIRPPESVH